MVNTPPADCRPILTYVGEQDPSAISEALRREMLREGQSPTSRTACRIDRVARDYLVQVPEAQGGRAPTARWTRAAWETVALDFWERRYDVLVWTTIIQSGSTCPRSTH